MEMHDSSGLVGPLVCLLAAFGICPEADDADCST